MIKNPDYKWNNKFWELKGIRSGTSLDAAIRKAIKQISLNPGGIIIDISKFKNKQSCINGIITKRMKLFGRTHGCIIIKSNNKSEPSGSLFMLSDKNSPEYCNAGISVL